MRKISHYSLIEILGSGGMGDVFLAEDEVLGRKVAIKLLPEQFTRDAARLQRFQKEARLVSALNHPNILTIFEIGEADGQHFIVTEFIDGETLRDRLARGSLTSLEIVDIAAGVAGALAEAHGAGVIHRDIKPENIMIRRDGLIKVLDFGLAKRTGQSESADSATAIRETAPGTVLGTVSYMSPEQARGLPVDARADLFSLGAVLYEALTAHVPFEGKTTTDILAAILHHEPPPMDRYSSDVPRELKWVVEKALHKDRDERFQTAKEMLADLRHMRRDLESNPEVVASSSPRAERTVSISAPAGTTRTISSAEYIVSGIRSYKKSVAATLIVMVLGMAAALYVTRSAKAIDSVAVLPFTNAPGDQNAEYIADGMTENLINNLSEISGLRVLPRSSVFRYKGSELPLEQIAKELGTRTVLTGRLKRQGNSLVLQAELVDAAAHSQIWGGRFDAPLSDLMAMESKLAQQAVAKLRPQGTNSEQKRVEKKFTSDPEAYDLYMKGRYYWNKRTLEDIRTSQGFFQRAIDRDPNFALAWAGLADVYIVLPTYDRTVLSGDAYPKARQAALEALKIDPQMAEPHATLAGILFEYDWNIQEADKEFRRAIELKPQYAPARHWYADYLKAIGRFDESIAQAKAGRDADPLSIIAATTVAFAYSDALRPDESLRELQKVVELNPEFPLIPLIKAKAYLQKGMLSEAAQELDRAAKAMDDEALSATALMLRGRRAEAAAIARKGASEAAAGRESPYHVATLFAVVGEKKEALRWLEQAYAVRSNAMPYMAIDPSMDALRNEPGFKDLLRRVGLPQDLPFQSEFGARAAQQEK